MTNSNNGAVSNTNGFIAKYKEIEKIIPFTIAFMKESLSKKYEKSFCLVKVFDKESGTTKTSTLSKKEEEKRATHFILTARSLKLDPIQALVKSLLWVDPRGNIERSIQLKKRLYFQHGHTIELVESTEERCKLIGKRRCQGKVIASNEVVVVRTTLDDSLAWEQQPEWMLVNKAISELIELFFPEVVGGSHV